MGDLKSSMEEAAFEWVVTIKNLMSVGCQFHIKETVFTKAWELPILAKETVCFRGTEKNKLK